MAMTEQQHQVERRYLALIDLFGSDGWKIFSQELAANLEAMRDGCETADGNDAYRMQGGTKLLRNIMAYELSERNSYQVFVDNLDNPEFWANDDEDDDESF